MLPDLFGEEGHERVQETHTLVKYRTQNTCGCALGLLITLHLHLGNLHIPVAIVGPEEVMDLATSFTKLEIVDQARHRSCQLLEAASNPTISQRTGLKII